MLLAMDKLEIKANEYLKQSFVFSIASYFYKHYARYKNELI